ncbi:MAG TPA: COX15/CtaA family protein [Candidatus Thermoplasmatota archaeon]|nr:COX15/CtaA family protein [Candidatus Thermoplasmatota archaeon]
MDARLVWVRRLGVVSVAMTFILMVLGAWVKANGAGLSCPDWPACYGSYFPPFPSLENGGTYHGTPVVYTQAQILYEWTHRAVVGLIIVPVLALAILAARDRRFTKPLRTLPVLAVGIYVLQALLGAVTVVTGNPPWATTLHLATAVLWFFTLTLAACHAFLKPLRPAAMVRTTRPDPEPQTRRVQFTYPEPTLDADEARDG